MAARLSENFFRLSAYNSQPKWHWLTLWIFDFHPTAGICGRVNGDRPVGLHGINPVPLMSALGQKRTSRSVEAMSASPPKADIGGAYWDVCFVPKADMAATSALR